MYSFNHTIPYVAPDHFVHATKDLVYGYLLELGPNPSAILRKYGVPTEDTQLMLDELDQFEAEVISKTKGTFELTPATYNEDGSVKDAATYFVSTGRVMMLATIFPAYVPKDLAMNELIACYPTYNAARTYNQFVIAVRS